MSGRLWLTPWTRCDIRGVPFSKSSHDRRHPDKFGLWRDMGGALGCTRLAWRIGYLPSGRTLSLYHRHPAQEEAFYIRRGAAVADIEGREVALAEGDFLRVPPGVGQLIGNESDKEVEILTIGAPRDTPDVNYPRDPDEPQGSGANPLPEPPYHKVNEADVAWSHSRSAPTPEQYGQWRRIGEALGCEHIGLRIARMGPGVALTPYHRHKEQEEVYLVLAGHPTMDIADKHLPLRPDEAVRAPADLPRRLRNAGGDEAIVLCLSAPYVAGDNIVLADRPA